MLAIIACDPLTPAIRPQMLAASWELHKFFHDCKDTLNRIMEKQTAMSDELGRDAVSVSTLQRKHQNFLSDLQNLQQQVRTSRTSSSRYDHSRTSSSRNDQLTARLGTQSLSTVLAADCKSVPRKPS